LEAVGILAEEDATFTCIVTGYTGTPVVTWWKGVEAQTEGLYPTGFSNLKIP